MQYPAAATVTRLIVRCVWRFPRYGLPRFLMLVRLSLFLRGSGRRASNAPVVIFLVRVVFAFSRFGKSASRVCLIMHGLFFPIAFHVF